MITQMKTLLRVKKLKQEQAFRTLQLRRRALEDAEAATRAAQVAVDESLKTIPAREDAIYAEILGRAIALGDVDDAKARVLAVHAEHQILIDERERTAHVEARARRERDEAVTAYQDATKVTDKYGVITDDLVTAHVAAVTAQEDSEVEEMFARPRRKIA